ncbi:clasp N-terminal domain-containing protein [Cladochytrium replicatum]|nr:clasp N-terminal domain-containing protein [Cladochytrium replicatum]
MPPQSSAQQNAAIHLDAPSQLDAELKMMLPIFEVPESEDTWERFEEALSRLAAIVRGSNHLPNIVQVLRKLRIPINNSMLTERTRLSRTAMALLDEVARSLGGRFDPLVDTFVPTIIKITTRANKVFVTAASSTLISIVVNTRSLNIIPLLGESLKNSAKTTRIAAADALLNFLLLDPPADQRIDAYGDIFEIAIRDGAVDPAPAVRELSRKLWDAYPAVFPHRRDRCEFLVIFCVSEQWYKC